MQRGRGALPRIDSNRVLHGSAGAVIQPVRRTQAEGGVRSTVRRKEEGREEGRGLERVVTNSDNRLVFFFFLVDLPFPIISRAHDDSLSQ